MSHYIKQIYTNCLAQASYYVESNGEALVIDPIREPQGYLNLAKERGATIKYVLETHFHADFVSGHQELAAATGATIIYGPTHESQYAIKNMQDGETLALGSILIQAMHTPGHTPESTCYILLNEAGQQECIFSGDTLFVGDVGRPDLLDGVIISKEAQLQSLYTSLERLKALPDHLVVYPAHGPGSMCGKTIGTDKETTIGKEKATNYALQPMDFETFSATILDGQLAAPKYFVQNAIINRKGYEPLQTVLSRGLTLLTPEGAKAAMAEGAVILDTRTAADFAKAYIKGATQVGLDGQFAIWVGTLWDTTQPLVVIADAGREEEAVTRLARVGFDKVVGILPATPEAWASQFKVKTMPSIAPDQFVSLLQAGDGQNILDVRRLGEYEFGHLEGAHLLPLRDLPNQLASLDKGKTWHIHCAGGYRSMIAASVLSAAGFDNVINVEGGYGAISKVLNTATA